MYIIELFYEQSRVGQQHRLKLLNDPKLLRRQLKAPMSCSIKHELIMLKTKRNSLIELFAIILHLRMKGKTKIYSQGQLLSGGLMIVTLLWLAVSTPFVYAAQKAVHVSCHHSKSCDDNPFSNTTEEKSETGVNTLSEYLHEGIETDSFSLLVEKFYKCRPSDLYFAFHPELISPPPEA